MIDPQTGRKFVWRGRDASGHVVQGETRAASAATLRWQLARREITMLSAVRQPLWRGWLKVPQTWPGWRGLRAPVAPRERVLVMRQLATLLGAGVPLLQALQVTAASRQKVSGAGAARADPMAGVLALLQQYLHAGYSLAEAMAHFPDFFDALTRQLVAAGELSGTLGPMCEQAAGYLERSLVLREKVHTALLYPLTVISMALLMTLALLLWVIPGFATLYANAGAALPWPTRLVMQVSEGLQQWGGWIGLALSLAWLVLGGLERQIPFLRRQLPQGRFWLLIHTPLLGSLLWQAALARWASTLATLLGAGVALPQALAAAVGAGHWPALLASQDTVIHAVQAGQTVATALQSHPVFPPMLVQMASVGEESGALDVLMHRAADYYEQQVTEAIARVSSLIEPVLMVVLGLLIGGLVIAMYLPVFEMGSVL